MCLLIGTASQVIMWPMGLYGLARPALASVWINDKTYCRNTKGMSLSYKKAPVVINQTKTSKTLFRK